MAVALALEGEGQVKGKQDGGSFGIRRRRSGGGLTRW